MNNMRFALPQEGQMITAFVFCFTGVEKLTGRYTVCNGQPMVGDVKIHRARTEWAAA